MNCIDPRETWSGFSLILLTLSSSSCCLLFSSTAALRSSSLCLCSSSRLQRSSTVRSYCSRALRSFSRISCSLAAESETFCSIYSHTVEKSNNWNKHTVWLQLRRFTEELKTNTFRQEVNQQLSGLESEFPACH